jgi:hypothetical protein
MCYINSTPKRNEIHMTEYKHSGKELKFIQKCAIRMNLDWKSIAARPQEATVLVNCFNSGANEMVAITAYTHYNARKVFELDMK